MEQNPALELIDLHYRYTHEWTREKVDILKGISLDIKCGEAFGFLGANGAGKTTTIRNILGLTALQSGDIKIFNASIKTNDQRKYLGFVPEHPYFYDSLTVQETMNFFASLAEVPNKLRKNAIAEALEKVKFPKNPKVKLKSLSKGLTQRVAMAKAIVHKPRLLILDEPFSGLDPVGRREFRDLFWDLKAQGCTLFLCSHILADVEYLCDRASIMNQGKIVGIFDLKEPRADTYELVCQKFDKIIALAKSNEIQFTEQGDNLRIKIKDTKIAEKTLKECLKSGVSIHAYTKVSPSLEDIFMQVIQESNRDN
jgi:ABC-2 type transport system ATP-binding protein